jgi:hypothetical protein
VSGLSAPWLLLPFLVGWTQERARRAAVAGLVVTLAALAGYFAMTLSPIEGVHFQASEVKGLLGSNRLNEVGGGPTWCWHEAGYTGWHPWSRLAARPNCCEDSRDRP